MCCSNTVHTSEMHVDSRFSTAVAVNSVTTLNLLEVVLNLCFILSKVLNIFCLLKLNRMLLDQVHTFN